MAPAHRFNACSPAVHSCREAAEGLAIGVFVARRRSPSACRAAKPLSVERTMLGVLPTMVGHISPSRRSIAAAVAMVSCGSFHDAAGGVDSSGGAPAPEEGVESALRMLHGFMCTAKPATMTSRELGRRGVPPGGGTSAVTVWCSAWANASTGSCVVGRASGPASRPESAWRSFGVPSALLWVTGL